MDVGTCGRRSFPSTRTASKKGYPMNLTRTTITAGIAALSLAASASPAFAKGGGDINNTVVSISPTAPAPVTTSGGGSGGGGSNRPAHCAMIGFDPITGIIAVCSSAGA
jgi:hypothetical protein